MVVRMLMAVRVLMVVVVAMRVIVVMMRVIVPVIMTMGMVMSVVMVMMLLARFAEGHRVGGLVAAAGITHIASSSCFGPVYRPRNWMASPLAQMAKPARAWV